MKCEKCGKEIAEGLNLCSSCKSDLVKSNKEKPNIPPIGIFGWAAATAYGIPVVKASVKDNKDSAVVRAASAAAVAAGAIAYGIPAPNAGSAVAAAGALGVQAIPCPEGAARTLYGMPPISSRNFEDRDYERVKDTKLCNHCSAKIKLDDKVCPQCGKKLGFAALCEAEDEYKKSRKIIE